jgi:hypothetical protein
MAPEDTLWPTCKRCAGPMQFLAQLYLPEVAPSSGRNETLLLFQCQNDPGLCDEWDANSGGNKAILDASDPKVAMVIPTGPTLLSSESKFELQAWAPSAGDCLDAYLSETTAGDSVLGKAGGVPSWLQGQETPNCTCGSAMQFVIQIDSGAAGGINFGDGGIGYAFICNACPSEARFLWQCL